MEPVLGVPVVGDFSFVKNSLLRESLTYDFKEINKIGEDAWEAFRNHDQDESFMYNTNGGIWDTIANNMYSGHSGASYGITMRCFEKIAKYGWTNFVNEY